MRVTEELESETDAKPVEGVATYTVRLRTSNGRGSRLDDPDAGILFGLVGRDGDAFMHRIGPCDDHEGTSYPRFQEGMVDEVTIRAPDIGTVVEMWVAPESGTWELEEATVSCTKGGVVDTSVYRFLCRTKIGEKGEVPAIQMKPVRRGAEIDRYNDPMRMTSLSPAELAAIRAADHMQYEALKKRLLFFTAGLVLAGSGIALLTIGEDSAVRFGLGGATGLFYLMLLQRGVDDLPGASVQEGTLPSAGPLKMLGFLGSPMTRLVFVGMIMFTFFRTFSGQPQSAIVMREMLEAGLGFMMYKLSILLVAFGGEPTRGPEHN